MSARRRRKSRAYLSHRRWTPQIAQQALDDLAESGLSASAFAKREGLCAARLLQWRRRLTGLTPAPVSFEEVPASATAPPPIGTLRSLDLSTFGIVMPSGNTVRLPEGFTVEMLARLLYILGKVYGC